MKIVSYFLILIRSNLSLSVIGLPLFLTLMAISGLSLENQHSTSGLQRNILVPDIKKPFENPRDKTFPEWINIEKEEKEENKPLFLETNPFIVNFSFCFNFIYAAGRIGANAEYPNRTVPLYLLFHNIRIPFS